MSNYLNVNTITIQSSLCGSVNSTSFPMLFYGTFSNLCTTGHGGQVTSTSGYDIIFSSTNNLDGSGKLPFEIVSWNAVTGTFSAYVQIPTLSVSSNTVIYILYGNSSVNTNQSSAVSVWSNGFNMVYHFGSTDGTLTSDSKGNLNLINTGATQSTISGAIGGYAASFGGSAVMQNTSAGSFLTPTGTIEAWINPTLNGPNNSNYYAGLWNPSNGGYFIRNNNSQFDFDVSNTSPSNYTLIRTNASDLVTGEFNAFVSTWTGSTPTLQTFYNGVLASVTTSTSGTQGSPGAGTTFSIGNVASAGGINGYLSEIRVSSVVRSASWILATYNNLSSPNTFYITTLAQAYADISQDALIMELPSLGNGSVEVAQDILIFELPTFPSGKATSEGFLFGF